MHALGVGLSMIAIAILLAVLAACSHSYVRYGDIEVSRWAVGTDLNIEGASWTRAADGSGTLRLEGASSENSKALEAAARGAAEGATKALAP